MTRRLGVIGAGRAGATLAAALQRAGYPLQGVSNENLESTVCVADLLGTKAYEDPALLVQESEVVFLAMPDRLIGDVCRQMAEAGAWKPHHVVVHLSGAEDHQLLESARQGGAAVMSFHPLCSFARRERERDLLGVHFAVEGDEGAVALAREMVGALNGCLLFLPPGGKVLYHAAAVVASNYLVALAHWASDLLEHIGIDTDRGLEALLPLMEGTVENLREVGLPEALTGPVARGDVATVMRHLQALAATGQESESLYRALGHYTTKIAQERGLPEETAKDLNRVLASGEER